MLIEVRAKASWIVDGKVRKRLETYILDKEIFAEAEYAVMTVLSRNKEEGVLEDFEILVSSSPP